eukprot:12817688-Prorocentrum_lima.AAC.1
MTSSLVGSEMCIRDRLKDAVKNGLEKQTACQLLSWVGSSLAVHAVRTTPVSYTHLTLPTICSV